MELTLQDALIKAEVAHKLADKAIDMAMNAILRCKELESKLASQNLTQATEQWKKDIEEILPDEPIPTKPVSKLSPFNLPVFERREATEEPDDDEDIYDEAS